MARYEFIEHTADIAMRATGDSMEVAFSVAAEGMFDLVTGGAVINGKCQQGFEIESVDQEGLLVGWLSSLILEFDANGKVFSGFRVTQLAQTRLLAEAFWEPFDSDRHGGGQDVKGVSYHMMELNQSETEASVQVLFDV